MNPKFKAKNSSPNSGGQEFRPKFIWLATQRLTPQLWPLNANVICVLCRNVLSVASGSWTRTPSTTVERAERACATSAPASADPSLTGTGCIPSEYVTSATKVSVKYIVSETFLSSIHSLIHVCFNRLVILSDSIITLSIDMGWKYCHGFCTTPDWSVLVLLCSCSQKSSKVMYYMS